MMAIGFVVTALLQSAASPPTPGPVADPALVERLERLDSDLFTSSFERCDPDRVAELIAEDLEFYHDKDGLSYTSRDAFLAELNCLNNEPGGPTFSRRLVPDTLETFPIGEDYALQTGRHEFYEVRPDGEEIFREVAPFISLWKLEDGAWRLARVISYDHRVAGGTE